MKIRPLHFNLTALVPLLAATPLVLLTSGFLIRPQATNSLPTAQCVLDRYAKVSGERANLTKHTSVTIRGRYQNPGDKVDATTVSYSTKDGISVQMFQLPDGRHGSAGFDGHIGWNIGLDGKVSIQTGDIALTMARDADMYYHLHVMKYFKSLEVVGIEDFNGLPCYHLKGVNNWNQPNEQFYDKENGLLVAYKFNTAWRGGNGAADAVFEEYKPFDGILFATKTTGHDGNDMDISYIDSVTWDDVPASAVELPAAVKAKLAETSKK
jgi:hypothetical protein